MLGSTAGKLRSKYVSDYAVFDLETTGISAASDEVVEISALRVCGGKVVDEFTSLVNPGMRIPYGAAAVNGITDDMVKDARVFREVLADFFDFVKDMVLVGHNIHMFDMKFIYRDSERFYGKVPDNDYIDTLRLARICLPALPAYKLTDLAEYYGIPADGAHRALNDCRINQSVFECLAKEMTPEKAGASGVRVCAKCGSFMVKRNGKYGEFWGCSAYPECRHTMPL